MHNTLQDDPQHSPTILFDTDCVLCSTSVQFVLRHEAKPAARFVSAWSDEGRFLARQHGFQPSDLEETFLFVLNGEAYTKSAAALQIMATLRPPWRWGAFLTVIPRPVADWIYDRVARNRYRWFGRRQECFLPPPDQSHRFVSAPLRSEQAAAETGQDG